MYPGPGAPLLSHSMRRGMSEANLGLADQQPSEQRPGWLGILIQSKWDVNRGEAMPHAILPRGSGNGFNLNL